MMVSSVSSNLTIENWNFMGFHSDSMGCSVDFMGFNGKMVNDHEELVYQWDIVGIIIISGISLI